MISTHLHPGRRFFCRIGALFFFGLFALAAAAVGGDEGRAVAGRPLLVEVGEYAFVTRGQSAYLEAAINDAAEAGVSALVLRIDCPGGLASAVRRFVERATALDVPVVAWVEGDSAGAGALAALAADAIYFAPEVVLGGEVGAIDWRGPSEELPSRLVDLRYGEIADDLVGSLAAKGYPEALIRGLCDPKIEVVIDGEKYSDAGDVLRFDIKSALAAGLIKGEAGDIAAVLAKAGIAGQPVVRPAPEVVLRRPAEKAPARDKSDAKVATAATEAAAETAAEDGQGSFGATREESYAGKVVVIPVEMESLMRKTKFEFMSRIIKKADADGAEAIIFDLNTPGGIAWYTSEIMLSDLQHLSVPTYSFVNPKAMSAGALIAIATDHIYMHPPSTIGAAAPVTGAGQDISETMMHKVMGDILSTADDVARRKGHNPKIAKAFIDVEIEISFEIPVVDAEGRLASRLAFDPDTENDLLVLNSAQATQVIDGRPIFAAGTATSVDDLVSQLGLKGEIVTAQALGFEAVADWIVKLAPILLLFGMAGAYMELKMPGFGVPGFISLICFGLFFFGHKAAGYLAGYEAVGLFLLGILLVVIEFFVFPGLFVFAIVGFLLIFGTLIYAMIDPTNRNAGGGIDLDGLGAAFVGPATNLVVALIGAGLLVILALRYLPSMPMMRWMILSTDLGRGTGLKLPELEAGDSGSGSGADSLIGRTGVAETDLRPAGAARFGSERLDVVSTGAPIESGAAVRIVEHEGSRVAVENV